MQPLPSSSLIRHLGGGTAPCSKIARQMRQWYAVIKQGRSIIHTCVSCLMRMSKQFYATEAACIAASPEAPSDTGACSLDDPQPKFSPPMMTG